MKNSFRFTLEFSGPDGKSLGQFPVKPDLLPVVEAVRFEALRCGRDDAIAEDRIALSPEWSQEGAPMVQSLKADAHDSGKVTVPVGFFRTEARKIEKLLVEQQKLAKGEAYTFKTLAYARDEREPERGPGRFKIETEEVSSRVSEGDLTALSSRCETHEEETGAGFRAFFPQQVLDETRALGEAAGNLETGGILIGHLSRDTARQVVFIEVTAQIAATHTSATATSLSFSDESWAAARAAIALRKDGSQALGWWHNHPAKFFCNEACPMAQRLECAMQQPFLSADDLLLHRAVFPKAWQIALLVNVADAGTTHTVWGWQQGCIGQLPLHTLSERNAQNNQPSPALA